MDISYASSRIEKICTDEKQARKKLGPIVAQALKDRLDQMADVETLENLRFLPGGWHELAGDRKGEIACSLSGRVRLIFIPANNPRPIKPDGGLNWSKVTAIMNLEIVDYHK
jgi:proteic killer suppression protein